MMQNEIPPKLDQFGIGSIKTGQCSRQLRQVVHSQISSSLTTSPIREIPSLLETRLFHVLLQVLHDGFRIEMFLGELGRTGFLTAAAARTGIQVEQVLPVRLLHSPDPVSLRSLEFKKDRVPFGS